MERLPDGPIIDLIYIFERHNRIVEDADQLYGTWHVPLEFVNYIIGQLEGAQKSLLSV